jgi:hypothetical protein
MTPELAHFLNDLRFRLHESKRLFLLYLVYEFVTEEHDRRVCRTMEGIPRTAEEHRLCERFARDVRRVLQLPRDLESHRYTHEEIRRYLQAEGVVIPSEVLPRG